MVLLKLESGNRLEFPYSFSAAVWLVFQSSVEKSCGEQRSKEAVLVTVVSLECMHNLSTQG